MRTPATEDLIEAARHLKGESLAPPDVLSRVATWLETHAFDLGDRRAARNLGCSLKYYRHVIKAGK